MRQLNTHEIKAVAGSGVITEVLGGTLSLGAHLVKGLVQTVCGLLKVLI